MKSISKAINTYLETVSLARSENTHRTYQNGLNVFKSCLEEQSIDIKRTNCGELNEKNFAFFINELKFYAPTTERLYITSVIGFFEYLISENLSSVNIFSLKMLVKTRARIPRQRLPQFPKTDIDKLLDEIEKSIFSCSSDLEKLINSRDRAVLICLADT